jgi:hypothetical protein
MKIRDKGTDSPFGHDSQGGFSGSGGYYIYTRKAE